jgi:hypothetical protein
MCPDAQAAVGASEKPRAPAGRPRLGRPRRIRITTTIEPMKLILLREHAQQAKKSLGQLADEYVAQRFSLTTSAGDGANFEDASTEPCSRDANVARA